MVAVAAGLHLLLCALAYEPEPYVGGDNATYVALARGILERGAYVDYWDPAMAPHTLYPPAFPLLLAGGMLAGLSVWGGVKILCIAFSGAAVGLSALWLRRILPPVPAAVVAVLVAMAPAPLALANQVLSDVPFWTFTMLALWAYGRADESRGSARWLALGAAAVVLAFFTRIAGLPLVLAAGLWLALRREYRGLAMLGGSLGPLAIAWWLRNRAVGGTSAYASEFWWVHPYNPSLGTIGPFELLVRIYENVIRYGTERLPSLFFWEGAELTVVAVSVVVVLIVLAIVGWAGRLRRPGVAELFLPLYIGLLLVWPATWSGERFLLPILPLLLGYAALTLLKITGRVRMPVLLPAGAAALLAAGMVYGQYGLVQLASECRRGYAAGSPAPCLAETWTDLLSIGPLLRGRLPPGSVVIHRKPSLFFVASGYRSRLYPKSPDPQVFFQMVRESGADYVVVDQIADMAPYIHSVVTSANRYFCIVPELSFDNAVLMRIVPDAPPMPARAEGNDFRKCGVEQ